MLTPQPPRRRRSQQGVDSRTSKQPHGPSRCSAPKTRALCTARCAGGAGPVEVEASCLPPGRVELVETWVLLAGSLIGGVPGSRAGAGSSPRRARYFFFASPKKSTQKKGDPQPATPSLRYGANLRRGGCGVRRRTHCAPAALRSDNCGESVHEACALRRACSPRNRPAAGAASRGWTAEHPNSPTGHRVARPHLAGASATRCAGGAEQRDGPCGCLAPHPFWMRLGRAGGGVGVCRRTHAFVL